MLLLKFTFCFFCCSLGCPLDMCALRAKVMIASNFSWEKGWERVKSGLLSNIPASQTSPMTTKIHADMGASRSIFCIKRNSLISRSWEIIWKAASLELPQLSPHQHPLPLLQHEGEKHQQKAWRRRKGREKRNTPLLELSPGWEKVKEHPSFMCRSWPRKEAALKCLFCSGLCNSPSMEVRVFYNAIPCKLRM